MDDINVDVNEVIAEMDELGRAKFDAAHQRVLNKHLVRRVAELENERSPRAVKDTAA